MKIQKKKIGIFSTARSEISYLLPIMLEISKNKFLDYKLFLGGTHLSSKFGKTSNELKKRKIKISDYYSFDASLNDSKKNIINSFSHMTNKLSKIYEKYKFDYVIVMGDRFEKLAEVCNAILYNKYLIHLHGGEETTGVIDNTIRAMLSKCSNLHFVTCNKYKYNLIKSGEKKETIHVSGSLSIDVIKKTKILKRKEIFKKLKLNHAKKVCILNFHPTSFKSKKNNLEDLKSIVRSLEKFNTQIVITSPGLEHGYTSVLKFIEKLAKKKNIFFYKSLGIDFMYNLIFHCSFVIGNSSSGITEVPYYKVPSINLGDRQKGRILHKSVIQSNFKSNNIEKAVIKACSNKFRKEIQSQKFYFGNGRAAKFIVKKINQLKNHKLN